MANTHLRQEAAGGESPSADAAGLRAAALPAPPREAAPGKRGGEDWGPRFRQPRPGSRWTRTCASPGRRDPAAVSTRGPSAPPRPRPAGTAHSLRASSHGRRPLGRDPGGHGPNTTTVFVQSPRPTRGSRPAGATLGTIVRGWTSGGAGVGAEAGLPAAPACEGAGRDFRRGAEAEPGLPAPEMRSVGLPGWGAASGRRLGVLRVCVRPGRPVAGERRWQRTARLALRGGGLGGAVTAYCRSDQDIAFLK